MRWDNLFDDLEGQLEQELGAEETDLRAEEERLRLGRLTVRDRLVALEGGEDGEPVRMMLTDGSTIELRVRTFGRDWISGEVIDHSAHRIQFILPLEAIAVLLLTRPQVIGSLEDPPVAHNEHALSRRLGLAFVLRDLCRRRQSIELVTRDGVTRGTIDRVGRDHLDLAVHEGGTARRESQVTQYRIVPFSRLLLVKV